MKRGRFSVNIVLKRKHFYTLLSLAIIAIGAVLVTAFGGNNPAVLGHSAGELIVNSTSIVDGSVTGTDIASNTISDTNIAPNSLSGHNGGAGRINEATLSTVPSASTASTATNCGDGSNACHLGAGTGNNGDSSCSSNPPRWGSDSCYANLYSQNGLCVPGGSCLSTSTVIGSNGDVHVKSGNSGGTQVLRCTTAGTLPVGALTISGADCGSSTGVGIFVP